MLREHAAWVQIPPPRPSRKSRSARSNALGGSTETVKGPLSMERFPWLRAARPTVGPALDRRGIGVRVPGGALCPWCKGFAHEAVNLGVRVQIPVDTPATWDVKHLVRLLGCLPSEMGSIPIRPASWVSGRRGQGIGLKSRTSGFDSQGAHSSRPSRLAVWMLP